MFYLHSMNYSGYFFAIKNVFIFLFVCSKKKKKKKSLYKCKNHSWPLGHTKTDSRPDLALGL